MRLSFLVLSSLLLAATVACGSTSSEEGPIASEDEVTSSLALETLPVPSELLAALARTQSENVTVSAERFGFDTARARRSSRVVSALRGKLSNSRLRRDQGEIDREEALATLEEFEVVDRGRGEALVTAIEKVVGPRYETRKLTLTSEDVSGSDTEWAEADVFFVSMEKGTAVRLKLRYTA